MIIKSATTIGNDNSLHGHWAISVFQFDQRHALYYIHPSSSCTNHLTKSHVFLVQIWCGLERNEKFRLVGIGSGIGHANDSSLIVGNRKRFIVGCSFSIQGAVATRAIKPFKISSLDHEFVNNAMKFTSSVGGMAMFARRGGGCCCFLAGQEGDEIRTRIWDLFLE
jgi:hypothetical protein